MSVWRIVNLSQYLASRLSFSHPGHELREPICITCLQYCLENRAQLILAIAIIVTITVLCDCVSLCLCVSLQGQSWWNKKLAYGMSQEISSSVLFSSVQWLSRVQLFATPWISAHQASLSITNFWSSLKLTSIKSVMPSSHLILCRPLLLLPPIPPSSRVFSNESTFPWGGQSTGVSALASFLPKNTQDWSLLEWTVWISLQAIGLSRVFSNTTVQKHQFFGTLPSSQSNSHIHTWPQENHSLD